MLYTIPKAYLQVFSFVKRSLKMFKCSKKNTGLNFLFTQLRLKINPLHISKVIVLYTKDYSVAKGRKNGDICSVYYKKTI